ncbi:uncharacterized protein BCR38DRAFT_182637 [Pseudomassariella vexata]|uniref:Glycosyl transferase CAP10 domain-containing protein n=1 Tax=Pseudomassariella vexata TaxID=1141098 RepID=A0A1Y2E521_9PEZI|nr:uncharacterized protein BCR38DRAFT_182637 [Pseudomassariella vexata]ORY66537.1 hypothetical protein BCR38DRAFT_182637 [Pseudomassariella vexata]
MAQLQNVVLSFFILGVSSAFLTSRYYQSAAFERPFHFSILTLLLAGLAIAAWARPIYRQVSRFESLPTTNSTTWSRPWLGGRLSHLEIAARSVAQSQSPSWFLLLFCIVGRTILYWRTIQTIHCSWDGLQVRLNATRSGSNCRPSVFRLSMGRISQGQTFLPLVLRVVEILEMRPLVLPSNTYETTSHNKSLIALYVVTASVWGIAATDILFMTEHLTGAICAPGAWERLIPLAQLVTLGCDALIITLVSRLRQGREDKKRSWWSVASLLLVSAGILLLLSLPSFFSRQNFRWNMYLDSVTVRDLALDSIAAAAGLIAGTYLLGALHPTTVALAAGATSVFVYMEGRIFDGTMNRICSSAWGLIASVVVVFGPGVLLHHAKPLGRPQPPSDRPRPFYRSKFFVLAGLTALLLTFQAILWGDSRTSPNFPTYVLYEARAMSENWISKAKQSNTLDEAVLEYRTRYGVPPPPDFDKWYRFAVLVDSPIIDDFGQIHSDFLPFWGTLPVVIRQRTAHLLEHPINSFGGLTIEDGKVELSAHVHGTHKWMLDEMKEMIEPFAKWLPDMQLAFNLDDECRVSVPFDLLQAYENEALKSRARLASKSAFFGFSKGQSLPVSKEFLVQGTASEKTSPWFQNWSKAPIFYEWISSTCPPDSPVRQFHWWNRKADCPTCSDPHMTDGVVSDWKLSGDLCHQPDLAYLHGFLSSPSIAAVSHTLFPVFSQSRMHNFNDILHPSPWSWRDEVSFEKEKGIAWNEKLKSVFWRGAASDGYAVTGSWQTFLRARFVNMATHADAVLRSKSRSLLHYISPSRSQLPRSSQNPASPVEVNVTFVGEWHRCDTRDCALEKTQFYGPASAEPPPSVDFQEHWRHRHLVDLDGAAFSARFLPFLRSGSLPYRAALFRTWWEERVHAWRHFVPLDVRLGDLWRVVGYFGGEGDQEAEKIAREGREWAEKALRKEDMQVYMFRLLLEWGRIVDDRREELGYVS